jgi:hypothetical protein
MDLAWDPQGRPPRRSGRIALVPSAGSSLVAGAKNFRPNPASTGKPAAMKQEPNHRRQACTAGATPGCRTPAPTTCINGWATGIPVAPAESLSASGGQGQAPAHPPGPSPRTSVLRWQVLGIIDEVLNNADTPAEARSGLLRRLQGVSRPARGSAVGTPAGPRRTGTLLLKQPSGQHAPERFPQ